MIPPGQKTRTDFPRFGLPAYAHRFPSDIESLLVAVEVNEGVESLVDLAMSNLTRCTIVSDFHCVTTWSYIGASWSGVRFADFYLQYVSHLVDQDKPITGAVLYAQDGYSTTLLLEDLLQEGVMLADSLDGQPLTIEHGAPIRLVAPKHYGYKNLKHLKKIAFYTNMPELKHGFDAFLDHPRARVHKEERSRWIPGWILRYIYRALVAGNRE